MKLTINQILIGILAVVVVAIYHGSRPILTGDAAECAAVTADPETLPFISYSTQDGFNECVSRCMTNLMMQVCAQLPDKSNVFATHPEVKKEMLAGCHQNIEDFVAHNTRCPHLNCKP